MVDQYEYLNKCMVKIFLYNINVINKLKIYKKPSWCPEENEEILKKYIKYIYIPSHINIDDQQYIFV